MLEAYLVATSSGFALSWIVSEWAARDYAAEFGNYPAERLKVYRVGSVVLLPFAALFLFVGLTGYSNIKKSFFQTWNKHL